MPEPDPRPDPVPVEKSDIHPGRVMAVAGTILATLAVAGVAAWVLLRFWQLPAEAGPNAPPAALPSTPRLQAAPQDERDTYFAEKEKLLHSYEWLDRQSGMARIPIDAAMDILSGRGTGPLQSKGRP